MRYGMCIRNDQLDYIKCIADCGYDYVECRFPLFVREEQAMRDKLKKLLEENNIKCESCNMFMPGDLHVTGEEINEGAIIEYIDTGMKNAKEVGCEVIVFGSGRSRNLENGFAYDKGIEQIEHFLKDIAGPIGEKYGMTVVIEPLNSNDSNIINTVKEAVQIADRVNHPYISSLGDLYHMYADNESEDTLSDYVGKIKHCHIAEVKGRKYPKISDGYDYAHFIDMMEKAGCQRCSVEGDSKDFEKDTIEAMELFNTLK